MKFLVYERIDQGTTGQSSGTAGCSSSSLLRSFTEVLQELGEVVQLRDPLDASTIHAQCEAAGERCLLFSFAPPHETPLDLACPTIPVFAWAYPDIPEEISEESWRQDPRHDWRYVFHRTGSAIGLSTHTVQVVQQSMGPHYPIAAIPPPLKWRRMLVGRHPSRVGHRVPLALLARVADSRSIGLDPDGLVPPSDDDGTLFHPDDVDVLPMATPASRAAAPEDRGDAGIPVEPTPLGEGEQWSRPCGWDPPLPARVRLDPQGVVYTAAWTPEIFRTNWVDLLTAFCWTFRDNPDATLILKVAGTDLLRCHHELLMLLTKLSPFQCRVLSVSGCLTDEDHAALVEATTFYVNSSLCEGVCLPLVEFLAAGVPAIAPSHTAMADYVGSDLAFVVRSYPGAPAPWPHGDGDEDRTSFHQLDWQSLSDAFRRSYEVATLQPEQYAAMSLRAHETIRNYCGADIVKGLLQRFLDLGSEGRGGDAGQGVRTEGVSSAT